MSPSRLSDAPPDKKGVIRPGNTHSLTQILCWIVGGNELSHLNHDPALNGDEGLIDFCCCCEFAIYYLYSYCDWNDLNSSNRTNSGL